jgi:hypothetical protein
MRHIHGNNAVITPRYSRECGSGFSDSLQIICCDDLLSACETGGRRAECCDACRVEGQEEEK